MNDNQVQLLVAATCPPPEFEDSPSYWDFVYSPLCGTKLESRLAKQALAVMIIDLEYDRRPVHGHAPIRHQLLWEWAVQIIGEDAAKDLAIRLHNDVMEGKNAPVKTNPLRGWAD